MYRSQSPSSGEIRICLASVFIVVLYTAIYRPLFWTIYLSFSRVFFFCIYENKSKRLAVSQVNHMKGLASLPSPESLFFLPLLGQLRGFSQCANAAALAGQQQQQQQQTSNTTATNSCNVSAKFIFSIRFLAGIRVMLTVGKTNKIL